MKTKNGSIIDLARESADRYYRIEATERDLKRALEATKDEPGLSIADIVKNIKKVFQQEEVLKIKELL